MRLALPLLKVDADDGQVGIWKSSAATWHSRLQRRQNKSSDRIPENCQTFDF